MKGTVPSIFPWIEVVSESREAIQQPQTDGDIILQSQLGSPQEDGFDTEIDVSELPLKRQKVSDESRQNISAVKAIIQSPHEEIVDSQEIEMATAHQFVSSEDILNSPLTFDRLAEGEINLPPGWLIQKTVCARTKLLILFTNKCVNVQKLWKTFILKAVTVENDLSVQVTVLGKPVDLEKLQFPCRLTNTAEFETLLSTIHCMNVCKGCAGSSVDEHLKNSICNTLSKDSSDMWRHNDCSLLLSNVTTCKFCRSAQKTLATRFRRWKTGKVKNKRTNAPISPTQKKKIIRLRDNLRTARISQAKALKRCKSLKEELDIVQKRMAHCKNIDVEEHVQSGKITPNQAHVLKQIIDAAKHENSKGRNYSEEWMLLCMLLHMRSSSGYEFLRSNEILPLPCVRTIRRYAIYSIIFLQC